DEPEDEHHRAVGLPPDDGAEFVPAVAVSVQKGALFVLQRQAQPAVVGAEVLVHQPGAAGQHDGAGRGGPVYGSASGVSVKKKGGKKEGKSAEGTKGKRRSRTARARRGD